MAGRRTNLALLLLLPLALATGIGAYAVGTEWVQWVVVAHGVLGIAIVALAPWKSVVVRRSMRRDRPHREESLLFAGLVVVALVSGFLHSTGLLIEVGPVDTLQIHVAAALVSMPLLIVHAATRRERVHRTDLSRRQVLRTGALAGGAVAAYVAFEGPGPSSASPAPIAVSPVRTNRARTTPLSMPVTQWFNDTVPTIDADDWELQVDGDGERIWPYRELARFDDEIEATIDCTGGWYATQRWRGVRVDRLLGESPSGRSLLVTSHTGYSRRFPLGDAGDLLLATRAGGQPLSPGHGYPLRLVAPGRRGFWWVKWVVHIETSDRPWWLDLPFPVT
ncbi:MAG: molybdopterin-dependent oxidoreductase [Acidimicrobiia bacterium]